MALTSPGQKVPETLILTTSVYIVDEPVSPLGDLDCSRYPINLTEATSEPHYIQAEWTPPGGSWITFTGEPSTVGTIKAHPRTGPPDFTVWSGTVRYGIVSYHIISYIISYQITWHDMTRHSRVWEFYDLKLMSHVFSLCNHVTLYGLASPRLLHSPIDHIKTFHSFKHRYNNGRWVVLYALLSPQWPHAWFCGRVRTILFPTSKLCPCVNKLGGSM